MKAQDVVYHRKINYSGKIVNQDNITNLNYQ